MIVTTVAEAKAIISANPECFRPGFAEWLTENVPIVRAIFTEAHQAWASGIRKAGINKLIEYLRWGTMLRDATSTQFKISDEWTSSIARLWAMAVPDKQSLFTYKDRVKDRVVQPPKVTS